ncbi:tRNA (5-methylaminomethyl-2-thiouridine)(34)-methyltransferase MnmD [Shewanella sp. C32]|uniref:tRNA (5-methylaminomethyl-2-thiouridine)(34)-methyltransferase MnmD n=1 Tax=Shewanella electrica TaxID=515560 RepID=A0ABT2FP21_9GAMM|nr:tRNA (5-methylaminomethyl-2-thiouridine)(34)-methyltransferase MnmD [Shewanella electrica]MCH1925664.1 tRNA (5-methylaminomethyl-2-thiouridine)(34)-methyltransferase MnmD [Shewanella electrica]MCS4558087.1 tRNA (5-methylaminomethyl-2-thiouridine)(34)-methyltransferase MnmD [Shewanella electrica]
MDTVSLQLTEDGSHTLYNEELNETYHSTNGAIAEAEYVFIRSGLDAQLPHCSDSLAILEIGFGTGLNTLMTLGHICERRATECLPEIRYVSLEPFPIDSGVIARLNYPALLPRLYQSLFTQIHQAAWDQPTQLQTGFSFTKANTTLESYCAAAGSFDLIYFDAFAPNKQPDVWRLSNFIKCFELLKPNGLLVSYCANGQFKRNLKAAGFTVKPHPGALGKREMTRAWKLNTADIAAVLNEVTNSSGIYAE